MFVRSCTSLPRLLSTSVVSLTSTASEVHVLYEKKRKEILSEKMTCVIIIF